MVYFSCRVDRGLFRVCSEFIVPASRVSPRASAPDLSLCFYSVLFVYWGLLVYSGFVCSFDSMGYSGFICSFRDYDALFLIQVVSYIFLCRIFCGSFRVS